MNYTNRLLRQSTNSGTKAGQAAEASLRWQYPPKQLGYWRSCFKTLNYCWYAGSYIGMVSSWDLERFSAGKFIGLVWSLNQTHLIPESAILAVIHPELHNAVQKTFNRLREHYEIVNPQDILSPWTSTFNGVSVNFNHLTPAHQDGKSRRQWYDLLVTLGSYWNCNLELLGLGLLLEYSSGTVVGLMGSTLQHQVSHFEGERVCYAYAHHCNGACLLWVAQGFSSLCMASMLIHSKTCCFDLAVC